MKVRLISMMAAIIIALIALLVYMAFAMFMIFIIVVKFLCEDDDTEENTGKEERNTEEKL